MVKLWVARSILWLGIFLSVGMGALIPNEYDMIFLLGGLVVMFMGITALLMASKSRANQVYNKQNSE